MQHGYAQLDGIRLRYSECGSNDKDLVILLHGFPECWYSWRHQLPVLGRHWVQNEAVEEVNEALLEFLGDDSLRSE